MPDEENKTKLKEDKELERVAKLFVDEILKYIALGGNPHELDSNKIYAVLDDK